MGTSVSTPHLSSSVSRWACFVGILFLTLPLLFAASEAWHIPRKGNYDEICARGIETQGVVNLVSQDHDADDDYWTVVHFTFSHDGREEHRVAYASSNTLLKAGDPVAVRYWGNQAVLANEPPFDIDPTGICLLIIYMFTGVGFPIWGTAFLVMFVLWFANFLARKRNCVSPQT
jgi:hypothetical protein